MHENKHIFITEKQKTTWQMRLIVGYCLLILHTRQTLICGELMVKLCFFLSFFFQPIVALCRKHVLSHDPAC